MPTVIQRRRIYDPNPRILLNEQFNGDNLNLFRWVKTDTEGKLSVSGGNLVCAGGKATPAWADPALVSVRSWARLAGLTVEWQVTPGGVSVHQLLGFTDGTLIGGTALSAGVKEAHGIWLDNNGKWRPTNLDGNYVSPLSYSSAQVLWGRIVCKATGAYYYASTDGKVTWNLIWVDSSVTTTPLYAFIESYNAALTASQCSVYQGYAKPSDYSGSPTAPTPTLGAELLTDGDLENWTIPTNLTSWTESISGLSIVTQEAVIVQAGTYAARMDVDASNSLVRILQNFGMGAGVWGQVSAWVRCSDAGSSVAITPSSFATFTKVPGTTYVNWIVTYRNVAANDDVTFKRNTATSQSIYWDTLSVKALTLSTCLGTAVDVGTKNGISDSTWILTAGTQAGHVICLDDETNPLYFILCYHDGTNAILEICENGTYTTKISAAATYSAGAQIRIVKVGTGVALYYNGTQVGTTQTIDTSTGYGTKYAPFSTLSTNTPGLCAVNIGIGT